MQVTRTIIIPCNENTFHVFLTLTSFFRLPNSDINVTAFKKMAAIVGAFTRHISEISTTTDNNEFDYLINHIFSCPLRSEHGEQQSSNRFNFNDLYFNQIMFVFL